MLWRWIQDDLYSFWRSNKCFMDLRTAGMEVNEARPDDKLPYKGAWLWVGPEMIHLMQLPNPDPMDGRPEHGGRDRHVCLVSWFIPIWALALFAVPDTRLNERRRQSFNCPASLVHALAMIWCQLYNACEHKTCWRLGSGSCKLRESPARIQESPLLRLKIQKDSCLDSFGSTRVLIFPKLHQTAQAQYAVPRILNEFWRDQASCVPDCRVWRVWILLLRNWIRREFLTLVASLEEQPYFSEILTRMYWKWLSNEWGQLSK